MQAGQLTAWDLEELDDDDYLGFDEAWERFVNETGGYTDDVYADEADDAEEVGAVVPRDPKRQDGGVAKAVQEGGGGLEEEGLPDVGPVAVQEGAVGVKTEAGRKGPVDEPDYEVVTGSVEEGGSPEEEMLVDEPDYDPGRRMEQEEDEGLDDSPTGEGEGANGGVGDEHDDGADGGKQAGGGGGGGTQGGAGGEEGGEEDGDWVYDVDEWEEHGASSGAGTGNRTAEGAGDAPAEERTAKEEGTAKEDPGTGGKAPAGAGAGGAGASGSGEGGGGGEHQFSFKLLEPGSVPYSAVEHCSSAVEPEEEEFQPLHPGMNMLVVAGVQKGGTTWMANALKNHPELVHATHAFRCGRLPHACLRLPHAWPRLPQICVRA